MICVSCSHIVFKEAAYNNQPNIQSVHLVPSFSISVSSHYTEFLLQKLSNKVMAGEKKTRCSHQHTNNLSEVPGGHTFIYFRLKRHKGMQLWN